MRNWYPDYNDDVQKVIKMERRLKELEAHSQTLAKLKDRIERLLFDNDIAIDNLNAEIESLVDAQANNI